MRLIDADALEYALGSSDEDIYCRYTLEEAPTVDAEPVRHGRWKKAERNGVWVYSDAYRQCSECNDVIYLAFKMNYCPTCGAKMDSEREE